MKTAHKLLYGALGLVIAGGLVWAVAWPKLTEEGSTTNRSETSVDIQTESSRTVSKGNENQTPKLIIGSADAKLTMVEYSDFQCPICKRYFEGAYPEIIPTYVDTGKLKIEFRVETHIGAESEQAGEAAYCANDQGKFKAYHDELFRRQKGTNAGTFSYANLKAIAGQLGLDQAKFDSCLDAKIYQVAVRASHAESRSRISGTPTFFIGHNQRRINGPQPFETFRAIIESEL